MNDWMQLDKLINGLRKATKHGDDPEIERLLDQIQALNPEDPRMLEMMSHYCQFDLGDFEKGKDFSERWAKAVPDSIKAKAMLANCYSGIMEFESSIQLYLYIYDHLDEEKPISRTRLRSYIPKQIGLMSFYLQEEGIPVPALPTGLCEEAIRTTEKWEYHEFRGKVLALNGKRREALEQALKVLELHKGNADNYFSVGQLLAELGEYNEAVRYLKKALRSRGRKAIRAEGLLWLAYCYVKTGRKGRRALSPLTTWRYEMNGKGSIEDKIRGGCLLRKYDLMRKNGENLLRLLLSRQPKHSTLCMLRDMERDLGLRRMTVEELGISQYLEEPSPEGNTPML